MSIKSLTKNFRNAFVYSLSFSLVVIAVVYSIISLKPIDVLSGWEYSIEKGTYTAGQTIVVKSTFEKKIETTGISKRYIVCKTPTGNLNRIPIGESAADRPATAKTTSDIYLKIPNDIPVLPTQCYVEAVIEYTIYSFRKHVETNRTAEFTVTQQPQVTPDSVVPPTQDTDNEVVENSPKTSFKSNARQSPNPAVSAQPKVSESQQAPSQTYVDNSTTNHYSQETAPITPAREPGVLETVRGVLRDLL